MTTSRFLSDAGEPRAFVIISSARSGSNLLVSYLRQVSRAACFGEIFRGEFPTKSGWHKLARRLDLPASAAALHREDLTVWWELVLAQGLRRRRWLGAKIFYYHREADPVWARFEESDHRVLHLWRDATFDQYVSRLLAVASGEWKADRSGGAGRTRATAGGEERTGAVAGGAEPRVTFDVDDYRRYRAELRRGLLRTRERYGGSERYVELEYRQLSDHTFMETLLERLFGERVSVEETLRRQRGRAKLDYVVNRSDAVPFVADSLSRGFERE